MDNIIDRIKELKKEKDAVILAHYYVDGEVKELADYIGDSYYLSEVAVTVPQKTIILCGVKFMGESAKILNSGKKVIMANAASDCPMAHMADVDKIEEIRKQYKDIAVVCYINSTAEIKEHADVCVTSSNALKIVKALPQKNIYFIPDENLGRYIKSLVPEKNFILGDGFCHVHTSIKREDIEKARQIHPNAKVLAHPECTMDVLEIADYIGSTSGIIDYASKNESEEFIICTEMGILYELKKNNPNKKFYSVGHRQFCPNMKLIKVEDVLNALENSDNEIILDDALILKCNDALAKMLVLAK
ncbi:MAG: quinolinate synthase NadA [Bacillota bacterium]|nr:quinolinate synthase NadA [Bacillota bacterium]